MNLLRRRSGRRRMRADAGAPTWQDNRPAWGGGPDNDRYLHIPQIDRWRAAPYDMPPDPERGTVMQRVRQLVESLEGAIDEGTGSALDRLIESWVAAWISSAEAAYADHCAVISVHWGQASQWVAESARLARDEDEELDRVRAAYLSCRQRLSGEPDLPARVADDPSATPAKDQGNDN